MTTPRITRPALFSTRVSATQLFVQQLTRKRHSRPQCPMNVVPLAIPAQRLGDLSPETLRVTPAGSLTRGRTIHRESYAYAESGPPNGEPRREHAILDDTGNRP
jgi:hypothetical protein